MVSLNHSVGACHRSLSCGIMSGDYSGDTSFVVNWLDFHEIGVNFNFKILWWKLVVDLWYKNLEELIEFLSEIFINSEQDPMRSYRLQCVNHKFSALRLRKNLFFNAWRKQKPQEELKLNFEKTYFNPKITSFSLISLTLKPLREEI